MRLKLELQGIDAEIAKHKKIAASARKVIRRAVEKGATIQLQAARRTQSRNRTGLLKKSLGKVVRTYPSGFVLSFTGPRKGFKVDITSVNKTARRSVSVADRVGKAGGKNGFEFYTGKTLKLKGNVKVGTRLDPTKYGRLVEGGHKKGKGRSAARAYPFLSPAEKQTSSAVYDAVKNEIAAKLGSASE